MRHMSFVSSPADHDIWMRPASKEEGSELYEYILLYTGNILSVGDNAERAIRDKIGRYFARRRRAMNRLIYLLDRMCARLNLKLA